MKDGWVNDYHEDEPAVHVYPLGDLKEHELDGAKCWCEPRLECHGRLVVHNSADGREARET